jgi:hypothetical protein
MGIVGREGPRPGIINPLEFLWKALGINPDALGVVGGGGGARGGGARGARPAAPGAPRQGLVDRLAAALGFNPADFDGGRTRTPLPSARVSGRMTPREVPEHLTGHDAIDFTHEHVSAAYDRAVARVRADYDHADPVSNKSVRQEVEDARQAIRSSTLHRDVKSQALHVLRTLDDHFGPGGKISGRSLQEALEMLRENREFFSADRNPQMRDIGAGLGKLTDSLDAMIERVNGPRAAEAYRRARRAWSIYKTAEGAARSGTAVTSGQGVPTARSYLESIRQSDPSRDKSRFARGEAGARIPHHLDNRRAGYPLQTLGRQGQSVMGRVVPNSGTPVRQAFWHMISHFYDPATASAILWRLKNSRNYTPAGMNRLMERMVRQARNPNAPHNMAGIDPEMARILGTLAGHAGAISGSGEALRRRQLPGARDRSLRAGELPPVTDPKYQVGTLPPVE